MDTILYFYRKRGLEKPRIEPVGLKTYLLIRIGLDVEEGRWFDKIPEPRPQREVLESGIRQERGGTGSGLEPGAGHAQEEAWKHGSDGNRPGLLDALCRPWKNLRPKRIERKQHRREQAWRRSWEQEEIRWLAARERLLDEIATMLHRLAQEVAELAGDMDNCRCVYEDSLRKALTGLPGGQAGGDREWEHREGSLPGNGQQTGRERDTRMQEILPALWRKAFPVEEFQGYTQQFWVEQVFSQVAGLAALPSRFVILGTAPGLPQLLEAHVRRMKSLRWFLPSAEWNEELSAFVEDFYTEYGLAIELQLVEDEAALKRLRPFRRESVNIVDFTGESFMAVSAAPEGSVWLDMLSVEEKRRRIMAKGKRITYFSMKEIWKNAQKRCNCPLLP